MDILCWVILSIALLFCSCGLTISLSLIISIAFIFTGSLICVRWIYKAESDQWWYSLHQSQLELCRTSLPKVESSIPSVKSDEKIDRRITGSSLIDEQLHIVVRYFMRDFIIAWYSQISNNPQFTTQLQHSLQQTLVEISNRCKSTDWVSYLTTRLVDDVASHIRLFRDAKIASKSKKGSSSKELIEHFFDKELEKEKNICRDNISTKPEAEKEYLSDLVEMVLFFILPPNDFANMPVRSLIIEILVSMVILPLINQITDPDYINSLIICACADIPIPSEIFVSVIKSTVDVEELEAVRKLVSKELNQLRSRDSGGRNEGSEVKQQIASLEYLKQFIDSHLNRIDKGPEIDSLGMPINFDYRQLARGKLFQLPLEAILKNSLTLDHFLNYMATVDCQHYVNLYLNIECWRASVSERLCALELDRIHNLQEINPDASMPGLCHDYFSSHDLSIHMKEADVIYQQYLSEKANPRVGIDDSIVKRFILRMRSEKLHESWFDEVQKSLYVTFKEADLFLPAFKRSVWYIRLLAELDLLKEISRTDEDDGQSLDEISLSCLDPCDEVLEVNLPINSCSSVSSSRNQSPQPSPCHSRNTSLSSIKPYTITAIITGTEIVRQGNKSHAIYRVKVQRKDFISQEELWHAFRRYSEFYDFHFTICNKFLDLSSIPFPSKKMLNNLATWFLEKRMNELNTWLDHILGPANLQSHPGLQEIVSKFLDHTPYHSSQPSPNLARKVESHLVNPLRVGVKSVSDAVKSVPDTVLHTVDGMVDGLYRKLVKPSQSITFSNANSSNPDIHHGGSIDIENGEDNIPLRILLLLMDEVFDLRSKDQWFRRRLILFLKQILKAMFGDIVNRKIVDFVNVITSPEEVAGYIKAIKKSIWPNGKLSLATPTRDSGANLRAKVAARTCMLASITDEFKAILGTQTTSRGVLTIYDCVQWKPLNKRLLYVLLQGIIESLLNSSKVPPLLQSLIASSKCSHTTTKTSRRDGKVV